MNFSIITVVVLLLCVSDMIQIEVTRNSGGFVSYSIHLCVFSGAKEIK